MSRLGVEEDVVDAEHVQPREPLGVLQRHVSVEAAEEQDGPDGEHYIVELDAKLRVELLPAVAVRGDVPARFAVSKFCGFKLCCLGL